jgi:Tol biopolymer transport system component
MGEVYRAKDAKLGREVAIKVLPEALAQDPDRLARFEREAKVLASLNHPNIAQIYGVVEDRALVMELVEGDPLKGPVPVDAAMNYARQIAEALEAAHEKGIVHRDLKPSNILVKPDGTLKVLDFGLAKNMEAPVSDPENSPTMTISPTQAGMILGTAAYMAPEQARGKTVDHRADIWAFGVVLYEMITGKRLFRGDTVSDILAAVLKEEPRLDQVPQKIRPLLRRCLEKDPKNRLRDIGDWTLLIAEPQYTAPRASRWLPWTLAGALAVIAAGALWAPWREPAEEERALHLQINPPAGTTFTLAGGGNAISPDGRTIAFVASSADVAKLWVRPLDSGIARELAGTEGAQFPFWSPDSRSIGFFASGKLKRVDLSGGPISALADAPNTRGGAWTEDGTIVFSPNPTGGLRRVPASGGDSVPFTHLDAASHDANHRWPQFLPGGRKFLYLNQTTDARATGIYLASADRPEDRRRVIETRGSALYVRTHRKHPGCLVWLQQGTAVFQAFDPDRGEISGEPRPVPGGENIASASGSYYSGFSVSNDGTILANNGNDRFRLSWLNRDGKVLGSVSQPDRYAGLRMSPDGTRAALSVFIPVGDRDIWTLDLARGVRTRVSSGGLGLNAIWSTDGRVIAYYAIQGTTIFGRDASAAGPQKSLVQSSHLLYADDFSPDGRLLMYEQLEDDGTAGLWLLPYPPSPDGKPELYLNGQTNLSNAQFSPDGKWVAYTSAESGQLQIYVQSFPSSNTKVQVSDRGGNFARWRKDGKELFYRAPDGRLMTAAVRSSGSTLEIGAPAALFRVAEPVGPHVYPYDVAADGQRILTLTPESSEGTPLTVLINWQAGLKK